MYFAFVQKLFLIAFYIQPVDLSGLLKSNEYPAEDDPYFQDGASISYPLLGDRYLFLLSRLLQG
jgi:hypothetical protein